MSFVFSACHTLGCDSCQEITAFLAACKPVLDLPFQNGDEEWSNFFAARKRLEEKNIDFKNLFSHHEHLVTPAFLRSPLYEALFGLPPVIKPATRFASAANRSRQRVWTDITPSIFIKTCVKMNEHWHTNKTFSPDHRRTLSHMAKQLYSKQVNVLDFLSGELTDELLEAAPFLQLFINTLSASRSHVVVDLIELESCITALRLKQGFEHQGSMMIPPYPRNGKCFDQLDLLRCIREAESHMDEFSFMDIDGIESIDILHKRFHLLRTYEVKILDWMAGYEPTPGAPGAVMFQYIKDSVTSSGYVACELFHAQIASDGNGMAFLQAMRDPPPPQLMTREEAISFVDKLRKANIADIPRDAMRCGHCWSDFDEAPEEGVNNEPIHLPCDSRHLLGRDCLIEILSSMGPLCPICRQDMVEAAARAEEAAAQAEISEWPVTTFQQAFGGL